MQEEHRPRPGHDDLLKRGLHARSARKGVTSGREEQFREVDEDEALEEDSVEGAVQSRGPTCGTSDPQEVRSFEARPKRERVEFMHRFRAAV